MLCNPYLVGLRRLLRWRNETSSPKDPRTKLKAWTANSEQERDELNGRREKGGEIQRLRRPGSV